MWIGLFGLSAEKEEVIFITFLALFRWATIECVVVHSVVVRLGRDGVVNRFPVLFTSEFSQDMLNSHEHICYIA